MTEKTLKQKDNEALGERLRTARLQAGFTQEAAAVALTAVGYKTGTKAIGAWEGGRNIPDSLVLRRLAKLYGTTADSLLWDEAVTIEAIRFAVQYDALNERNQRKFKAMWLAFFEVAKSDEEVEAAFKSKAPKRSDQSKPA